MIDINATNERLEAIYSKRKAVKLICFCLLINEIGMDRAKAMLGNFNFYRLAKDLRHAGVMLPVKSVDGFPKPFRLEVPSPYVVNTVDEPCMWDEGLEADQPEP